MNQSPDLYKRKNLDLERNKLEGHYVFRQVSPTQIGECKLGSISNYDSKFQSSEFESLETKSIIVPLKTLSLHKQINSNNSDFQRKRQMIADFENSKFNMTFNYEPSLLEPNPINEINHRIEGELKEKLGKSVYDILDKNAISPKNHRIWPLRYFLKPQKVDIRKEKSIKRAFRNDGISKPFQSAENRFVILSTEDFFSLIKLETNRNYDYRENIKNPLVNLDLYNSYPQKFGYSIVFDCIVYVSKFQQKGKAIIGCFGSQKAFGTNLFIGENSILQIVGNPEVEHIEKPEQRSTTIKVTQRYGEHFPRKNITLQKINITYSKTLQQKVKGLIEKFKNLFSS